MNTPNRREELEARSRAYQSLSDVFVHGPRSEDLGWMQQVPPLAAALSSHSSKTEELAAEHHRVLVREVHPYASVFLSPDATLAGPTSGDARQTLSRAGISPDALKTEPDHLGVLLAGLGYLVAAELDANVDGLSGALPQLQSLQADLIDRLIDPWLPMVCHAIREQYSPLYTGLADLTLALVYAHRAQLPQSPVPHPWLDSTPIHPLHDPKTSLRDVAKWLVTPLHSGWYLSRGHLSFIAGELDLPCGFGNRARMLANLVHTAVEYDSVPQLMDNLDGVAARWCWWRAR